MEETASSKISAVRVKRFHLKRAENTQSKCSETHTCRHIGEKKHTCHKLEPHYEHYTNKVAMHSGRSKPDARNFRENTVSECGDGGAAVFGVN